MFRQSLLLLLGVLFVCSMSFAVTRTIDVDLPGTYTFYSDTTYILDDADVANTITLPSGTLTIQAGTTVKFAADNSLIIDGGATLTAEGTSSDSIIFTGSTATTGFWGQITFTGDNSNADGSFEYCVFEYGGDQENDNPFDAFGVVVGK